jgi:hypothetical protein
VVTVAQIRGGEEERRRAARRSGGGGRAGLRACRRGMQPAAPWHVRGGRRLTPRIARRDRRGRMGWR